VAERAGYRIVSGPEFTRVANELRAVDASFPGKLRAALRRAATPIVADVRMAALSLPARGRRHTGLRARLAKGVGVQAGVGNNARMRFVTKVDNPQEAELPRGEDSGERGWRHPVFGNQNNWVHQRGGSWFRETIADDRSFLDDRIQGVLDDAVQQIDRAGHQ
jgi:hypothetical protein